PKWGVRKMKRRLDEKDRHPPLGQRPHQRPAHHQPEENAKRGERSDVHRRGERSFPCAPKLADGRVHASAPARNAGRAQPNQGKRRSSGCSQANSTSLNSGKMLASTAVAGKSTYTKTCPTREKLKSIRPGVDRPSRLSSSFRSISKME